MTLEIAIIADDLTGALDTAAPFTARGYSVVVATRPDAFAVALAADAEVVVINTATRGLAPVAAATVAAQVAQQLKAARPSLVFKKIDSRLKGNAGTETAAIAAALGLATIRIAPAVPEQGRVTRGGAVVGRGVDAPIRIAPLFAPLPVTIEDAESDADLDRIVAQMDWSKTLAVGARGLGAAFARRRGRVPAEPFASERQSLFVIGSRDMITAQQIAALCGVDVHDAPGGKFAGAIALPACIRCVGPDEDAYAVARRLAESAVRAIAAAHPRVLVLSGGDTALAVLDRLGVGLVRPRGEAVGGLPWFTIDGLDTGPVAVVVKSGGFGDSNCLAALLPPANK